MKNKFFLTIVLLLTLALFSAACAAQDTTNEAGDSTTLPTTSTDGAATAEGTSEGVMTPTGSVDATPAQGTAETTVAPTTSADGTAVIPETGGGGGIAGVPDNLDEVLMVLRETGVSVELGDTVQQEIISVPGQVIRINGEEVQIFTYDSLEDLEVQASQLDDENPPEEEAYFYKLGNMLVRYVGSDPEIRDLLEDVLGAEALGE